MKQKQLSPWTAKINETQAALDVAKGERSLLSAKAEGLVQSVQLGTEQVETLSSLRIEKVSVTSFYRKPLLMALPGNRRFTVEE